MTRARAEFFIVTIGICAGFAWLWPRVQLLRTPIPESLLEWWAVPVSYLLAIFFVIYLIVALAALFRVRWSQTVMVAFVFVMALTSVFHNVALLRFYLEPLGREFLSLSLENVLALTEGLRWVLWFAFNYWFFLVFNKAR